ncbi:hypothetical protein ACEWY4_009622 [Coilia grayii]|uniref:RING-type domain-containing protein n=1 Tax=Coilia grayii TaxID=363190 RepID=A0ABD1K6Z8_9TELE
MGAGQSTIPNCERTAMPCTAKENTCRTCSSVLYPVQGTEKPSSPVVQCFTCPGKPFICGTCLSPWQGRPGDAKRHCPNKKCAVVGILLTCSLITDPNSKVKGCPEFRACPKCYSLMTHNGEGCNNIGCSECTHVFCYICLRDSRECMSICCFRAGRQWFST